MPKALHIYRKRNQENRYDPVGSHQTQFMIFYKRIIPWDLPVPTTTLMIAINRSPCRRHHMFIEKNVLEKYAPPGSHGVTGTHQFYKHQIPSGLTGGIKPIKIRFPFFRMNFK